MYLVMDTDNSMSDFLWHFTAILNIWIISVNAPLSLYKGMHCGLLMRKKHVASQLVVRDSFLSGISGVSLSRI